MVTRGLIFDLDGVITETAHLHYVAWKNQVAKIGINFKQTDNNKIKGLDRSKTLQAILEMYNKKLDEKTFQQFLDAKNKEYVKLLNELLDESYILPGIKKLLNDAKALGLKMSIASSSYNAPLILKKIKLKEYFDYIVNPADVLNGKPDQEIFLRAAKGIGLEPSEVIGFEDAIAGVDGLKDANIKTVAIIHNSKEDFSRADLVYKKTSQLNLAKILEYLG